MTVSASVSGTVSGVSVRASAEVSARPSVAAVSDGDTGASVTLVSQPSAARDGIGQGDSLTQDSATGFSCPAAGKTRRPGCPGSGRRPRASATDRRATPERLLAGCPTGRAGRRPGDSVTSVGPVRIGAAPGAADGGLAKRRLNGQPGAESGVPPLGEGQNSGACPSAHSRMRACASEGSR